MAGFSNALLRVARERPVAGTPGKSITTNDYYTSMAHLSPIDIGNEPVPVLAARLSAGLGLDQADIDLFSIEIEREWLAELDLVGDLFHGSDELTSERDFLLKKLASLMHYFSDLEEYERCVPIRDLLLSLQGQYCS